MAVLNSKFDILRGWPQGSAVAEDFPMEAGVTNPHSFRAGNFIKLKVGSAPNSTSAVACEKNLVNTKSSNGFKGLGLIIEGLEETSAAMSKTVTCLVAGGFMVRLHNEADMTLNAFGTATIPNSVNQFIVTRPVDGNAAALLTGYGTAAAATELADAAAAAIEVGGPLIMISGVLCAPKANGDENAGIVGTCLALDTTNGTMDILIH